MVHLEKICDANCPQCSARLRVLRKYTTRSSTVGRILYRIGRAFIALSQFGMDESEDEGVTQQQDEPKDAGSREKAVAPKVPVCGILKLKLSELSGRPARHMTCGNPAPNFIRKDARAATAAALSDVPDPHVIGLKRSSSSFPKCLDSIAVCDECAMTHAWKNHVVRLNGTKTAFEAT
jgi:hypothetical protein